ncbi:MAG: light dependent protochlorophyllide oxido-reductase [Synechococcus sp. Baikal-G1]|nr:MAG: light dependent protochlorophyllide oxido-reductase [Synechococcus sp. Baikal-G1]PHX87830.1 MAG: light dependent protochlorophyllide oxido-reductase [Synechococcus sp. Baikal-G1]
MAWSEADIPDQSGRIALVTGANSGLGLETARALAQGGATVLLACRQRSRGEAVRQQLLPLARAGLEVIDLDLADLASVAAAASQVQREFGRLDLLINNAGVMAPPRRLSRDGHELQFAVNHLGHFALTTALLPLLKQQSGARVVTVSSGAHYFGRIAFDDLQGERRYDPWTAYSQSKLANVMMALQLQEQLVAAGSSTLSIAAHPGLARTNLQPSSVAAKGSWIEGLAYRLLDPLFQSAAMGALPQLHAAVAPDARGGALYGPDGLANLGGWPVACKVAAAALDGSQRRRLWQASEELCGFSSTTTSS